MRSSRVVYRQLRPQVAERLPVRSFARPARLSGPAVSLVQPRSVVLLVSRRAYATDKDPSNKYPSDGKAHSSVKEVYHSAKSEIKGGIDTLADSIAGGHAARSLDNKGGAEGGGIRPWFFGGAGVIPYLATSLTTVYLARQASLAKAGNFEHSIDFDTADALLFQTQQVQLTYGAVILSFLGAIHWGFEFARYGTKVGAPRLILGILPLAMAWPSLMLPPAQGLVVQLGAFFLAWYSDNRATSWGWTPRWYSTYRFALTAAVGLTIIITIAGSSYFDPKLKVPGIGEQMIAQHAEQRTRFKETGDNARIGKVNNDVSLESAGDDADHYLNLRDFKAEEEERQKKEQEEQEAAEEEEKKRAEEEAEHANEKKTEKVKAN